MKKIKQFLKEYMTSIILVVLLILFFRGCGVSHNVKNNTKTMRDVTNELDSISTRLGVLEQKTLDENDVRTLIRTTRATQTLIDEELIDKKQLTLTDLYKEIQ